MAQIQQYDAKGDVTPSDKGIEAAVRVAGRVGQFGHQIQGDVDQVAANLKQHEVTMDASNVYARSTTAEQNLHQAWQQFSQDGANQALFANGTASKVFMDQVVDPTMQGIFGDIRTPEGQRLAAEETSRVRSNLFTRTAADQAVQTAAIFKSNWEQSTANQAASLVSNPSSQNLDSQLALVDTRVASLPAGVTGEERASAELLATADKQRLTAAAYEARFEAVRQEAHLSGKTGAAYDAAAKAVADQDHFQYLAPELVPKLQGQLDAALREGKEQFRADQDADTKQQVLAGDNEFLGLYHDLNTKRNNGVPLTADDQDKIVAYEKAHPHNVSQSMELERFRTQAEGQEIHRTFVHSDGDVVNDMWQRASLPQGDQRALKPTEVTAAVHEGKLNPADGNLLLKDIQQGRAQGSHDPSLALYRGQLMKWMATTVRPTLAGANDPGGLGLGGGTNPIGMMTYGEATREAIATFEGLRTQEHMSPEKAFETMTTPGTNRSFINRLPYWQAASQSGQPEDFFSLNANPDAYINAHGGWRAAQGITPPSAPSAAPAGAARQPGESADAYLKRRGM